MNRVLPRQDDIEHCDVLVIGSGAGGFSSAITARKSGSDVIIIEKEDKCGGTSALSGGFLWIPGNSKNLESGQEQDAADAFRYLSGELSNFFDERRTRAFLENGPDMVEFFETQTEVKFDGSQLPDYHPDEPGASQGRRSIVARPFDIRKLGARMRDLRPPLKSITFLGMMLNSTNEVQHFVNATRSVASASLVVKRLFRHMYHLLAYGRAVHVSSGNTLIARLAKSALDLGIEIRTGCPAKQIIVADGAVAGALVETPNGTRRILARQGVVVASGGFPHDLARRLELFPHETQTGRSVHVSPAPVGNTGDGIRMAETAGAVFSTATAQPAAWIPVSKVPLEGGRFLVFPHLIDRQKPGVVMVDQEGKRFCNEANSYHDVASQMIANCQAYPETAAWMIADSRTLKRYGMGFAKPFPFPTGSLVKRGYLLKGRTIEELAAAAGIDGKGLRAAIDSYNRSASLGEDDLFGRGTGAYNRYFGDQTIERNPCIGPIEVAPFYAIKVTPGDLGTFQGIQTDEFSRAIGPGSAPIEGLYVVGNDAVSIMGGHYPGGGITLGPAMTFGFIAGRHAAQRARAEVVAA